MTKMVHFAFEGKIFAYESNSYSYIIEDIYEDESVKNLKINQSEFLIENLNGEIIKFLPYNLKINPNEIGFVFTQYRIDFLTIPFNSELNPYKIFIKPFDELTTQYRSLCVAWKPFAKNGDCFFKIFTCIEDKFGELTFVSIKHISIESIESVFAKGGDVYHKSSDGTWKKLLLPLSDDCMFHYDVVGEDISEDIIIIPSAPILTFNELLISLPATKEINGPSLEILASSFNKKVLNRNDKQKSIILNYFTDSMKLFKTASLFSAPFVTICQSSGVGKSKFVLECGEDIPLIYGVFRAKSDKSYPLMSDWTRSFVHYVFGSPGQSITDSFPNKKNYQNNRADLFSMGRVLVYFDALLIAYRTLFEKIRNEGKSVIDAFIEINWKFHTSEGQSEFASQVKVKTNQTFSQIFDSIRVTVDYFKQLMPPERSESPFVIVFDELFLLLEIDFPGHCNLFDIIIRSLYLLPSDKPIDLLIVGIGTNVDVSVFHKELGDDSLRFIEKSFSLPSLILGGNWDIFKKFINLNKFKFTLNNVKNSRMIKLICSFGRALWSSLPLVDVIPVAQKKLLNGSDTKAFTKLAIWSIRTSLSFTSDVILARTLLRSYMAIAFSISYNAETMNIGYPSEPILAIAARDLTKNFTEFNFNSMLQALLEFVQLRPVDKGEITEIMFSQIVLRAIDEADNAASKVDCAMFMSTPCDAYDVQLSQIFNSEVFLLESVPNKFLSNDMDVDSPFNTNYRPEIQSSYHITTVESFLTTLYGDVKGEELSNSLGEILRHGIINASHVISAINNFPYENVYNQSEMESIHHREKEAAAAKEKLEGDVIDRALLRNLFIRQAALRTPPRYYGLDMCIPVLMKRSSDTDEDEGVFGYIGLQFKSTYESEASVIAKMDLTLHYVRCGAHKDCQRHDCQFRTNDQDLSFIFENHLLLYMAAANEDEAGQSENISTFKGAPCHVTKSINELAEQSKVLTRDHCGLIQTIIHAQRDPFKNIEKLQFLKVADNLLTMSPLRYSEADSDLRLSRGIKPLPDPFLECEKSRWSDPSTIKAHFIGRTSTTTRKTLAKQ